VVNSSQNLIEMFGYLMKIFQRQFAFFQLTVTENAVD